MLSADVFSIVFFSGFMVHVQQSQGPKKGLGCTVRDAEGLFFRTVTGASLHRKWPRCSGLDGHALETMRSRWSLDAATKA